MGKRRNHHNWLFPPPGSSRLSESISKFQDFMDPLNPIAMVHDWTTKPEILASGSYTLKTNECPFKKRSRFKRIQKEYSFVFRGRSIYQDPTTKDPRVLKKKKLRFHPRIFHFHISKVYVANQKQLKASKLHFLKQRPESMVEAPKSFPNNTKTSVFVATLDIFPGCWKLLFFRVDDGILPFGWCPIMGLPHILGCNHFDKVNGNVSLSVI